MKAYAYFYAIRNTTIQFLDLFNDIQVRRYDKNGNVIKTIGKVPLRYGPKSKIWNWIQQKQFDPVLPAISVFMTGIAYDPDRQSGAHARCVVDPNFISGLFTRIPKPAPYNVTYKVTIWSKYQEDLNQILENVLPHFRPFVYITLTGPTNGDFINLRTDLDSASPTGNEEYSVEDRRIITWDLEFTVRTWIFRGIDTNSNLIKKIYIDYFGHDSTVVHSVDGTTITIITGNDQFRESQHIAKTVTEGLDISGGVLDWEYSIYEPGDKEGPPTAGPFDGNAVEDTEL